jgi:hypothetical protein
MVTSKPPNLSPSTLHQIAVKSRGEGRGLYNPPPISDRPTRSQDSPLQGRRFRDYTVLRRGVLRGPSPDKI